MAHYRKIDPKIWNDQKFMSMSAHGQLACLFFMTHPHMTAVGGLRATIQGVASEHPKIPAKAFQEAFDKGIIKADPEAPLIWFPRFLKYNPPENPNVVKGWSKALDYLPECQTKNLIMSGIVEYLQNNFSEGFLKAFREVLPKGFGKTGTGTGTGYNTPPTPPPEEKPKKPKTKSKIIPPTPDEMAAFAVEKGFPAAVGHKAHEYYAAADWHDSQGNPVRNWKQKMLSVWLKEHNRPKNEASGKPVEPDAKYWEELERRLS